MGGDREPRREDRIFSSFADDPEMRELIGYFVEDLPQRTRSLEEAWEAADLGSLRRIAHQLKGAAGGYGFDSIGQAAGELEACARDAPAGEDRVRSIECQVRRLIDLCSRAAADMRAD
ncbi:MAG: Hpt domain-containing protein [Leptolyngbya sp. PLA3]|nr:MAG: Hpt domain-containing protein [Cyanobacteria bacterium CYA]MCE7967578.1 Hpt domain-containing protein [Leptolyngbya sp. PL-A3]